MDDKSQAGRETNREDGLEARPGEEVALLKGAGFAWWLRLGAREDRLRILARFWAEGDRARIYPMAEIYEVEGISAATGNQRLARRGRVEAAGTEMRAERALLERERLASAAPEASAGGKRKPGL